VLPTYSDSISLRCKILNIIQDTPNETQEYTIILLSRNDFDVKLTLFALHYSISVNILAKF